MAEVSARTTKLRERDLSRWRLIEDFQERLAQASTAPLHPTWSDPKRLLSAPHYLSLFLFGLLNPVVHTMRGLCAATELKRVSSEVCARRVSLGSFSAAQHVLDPELLARVFAGLSAEVTGPAQTKQPGGRRWLIQDSSLFEALPRMYWALWRSQGPDQSKVRLHLSLDVSAAAPARVSITPPRVCERAALRTLWQPGDAYVGDRYYGEDYKMFAEMDALSMAFVVRLREAAVLTEIQELPLTPADQENHVLRSAWVQLGCNARYRSGRVRVVWVQTPKEVLRLVTNLGPEQLTASEVALLYKERWQIELFFRWVKSILGCRHWLAESPSGAAIELYLALIGALLLQLYTGVRPNRRLMEMLRWYLVGMASLEELWAAVQRATKVKKSKTARA